ncbi:hypothetical protein TNCV_3062811 [Trichonephila clavipes]|nr:hypothetical protein TNCV_3062811 [Trichonephila clavipes]
MSDLSGTRHGQRVMNRNRYTNSELADIHHLRTSQRKWMCCCSVAWESYRSLGCIKTWRNMNLSEPKLTANSEMNLVAATNQRCWYDP